MAGLFSSCRQYQTKKKFIPVTIAVQPLAFSDLKQLKLLKTNIEGFYHFKVILLPDKKMPAEAYYAPRNRYKADKLIRILKNSKPDSADYIIGITTEDISVKKGKYPDFGIMGLGFLPGKSCVVSVCRLKTSDKSLLNERLVKVALHEIGHNLGLSHCKTKDCFMHAAEASIKQIDAEKLDMCAQCRKKITHSLNP